MNQFNIISPFNVCKIVISKGLPILPNIYKLLTLEELHLLIGSISNTKVKELSDKIIKNYPCDNINISESYPILFRGGHLSELNESVNLDQIQGRPEDNSYNGGIIHLTNSLLKALCYANSNKIRPFTGKTAVMLYDTSILSNFGSFEPDIVDGKDTITAIESINKCQQVRWSNYHPLGQQQRLSALIGIYELPSIEKNLMIIIL